MLNKKTEIIDISERIHQILYKVIIQVNDPQKIDQRILKDFIGKDRTQKVTLLKGAQTCEGDLLAPYPHSMGIKLLDKDFELKRNDTILVQFKHPTYDQHFVIQAVVKKVYPSWITTECQDPRYDQRFNFRLQKEIEFFELPQIFYDLIKKREVHIIRETLHQTISEGKHLHRFIENVYSDIDLENINLNHLSLGEQHFYPDYKKMLATAPLKGELRDISRGGICLLLDDELYDKRNLLLVRFNTPLVENINPASSCYPLFFNLLGSIRNFSTIGRKHGLHIQFLKRLEDDFLDNTFSTLEKYYKLTGKPL